jgi:cathepsin F
VEVSEASVQVVSGRLYKIKVKLGTSDCPKGTKDNCQLQAGSEIQDCNISVWSQPWLNKEQITIECPASESERRKRSLRGANYNQKMLQIVEDMKTERLFDDFVATYNRTYSTPDERNLRLKIFRENLNIIRLLRKTEQGSGRYGINMFADVSREEFRMLYLGLRPDMRSENDIPLKEAEIPDIELPDSFDWRQKGVVTSVKDQGACGSCWAFSVTGNVEGQYAIKHGRLLSLSEQELVDCDNLDDGCSGGLPDNAYKAIEQLGGLELESDYPYEAENEKCHFKKNLVKVQLASAVNITSDETKLAQWLVQNGPISIGINANAMQFYIGGVSHPFKFLCNPKNLDHGVLIVGYGTSSMYSLLIVKSLLQ